jgi:nitrite reductase (NADH) large subunit
LALSSGLATGRGVKVNDYLQTSDPLIFAAGECAEHAGRVYSLVGPGFEQADIVSQNLLGGRAKYHGSLIAAQLKGTDFPAFSCAREELDNVAESRTLTFEADAPKRYRALKLCKGRLMGAVGAGEWPEAWRIREAVLQNQRVSPAQSRSFLSCGNLWLDNMPSVAAWPKTATVCNCMGITKDLLDIAIEQGYTSIDELRKHTSAGTGCGSCLTLMAGLLDRPASLTSLEPDRRLASR